MSTAPHRAWIKPLAIALPVALAACPLSFVLWRTPPGASTPPPTLLPPVVAIEVVIPALAFGAGVAFLLYGRALLDGVQSGALGRGAFISIGWLLMNWWPHSNFHRVAVGWNEILLVDLLFHTTVILAGGVVALAFIAALREERPALTQGL